MKHGAYAYIIFINNFAKIDGIITQHIVPESEVVRRPRPSWSSRNIPFSLSPSIAVSLTYCRYALPTCIYYFIIIFNNRCQIAGSTMHRSRGPLFGE